MALSSSYVSRLFLAVVVWHIGPWRTFYLTGGFTTTSCALGDANVSVSCCVGQWFHVLSKTYYRGCYNTTSSDVLQTNATVSCFGGQTSSDLGSGSCSAGRPSQLCRENVIFPASYNGYMKVVLENECIEESDNHNLCDDLSHTATDSLYLASPSLFIARDLPARTQCRCAVHAESSLQMEILFADVSISRFTVTCGQWTISEDSFSTNVTNEVLPVPQNISDCVIEVDERSNGNNSYPVHTVWTKITGSSLTFRCNNNGSSSTPPPPSAETTEKDDSKTSGTDDNKALASSSSSSSSQTTAATMLITAMSSQASSLETGATTATYNNTGYQATSSSSQTTAKRTFVPDTSSSQTSSLETRQDALATSSVTRFQTHNNTGDQTNNAGDKASLFYIIYIVVGVVGGILLVIVVVLLVVFLRKKRRNAKYTSNTEAASGEIPFGAASETGFHSYEGVDLEENIQQSGGSHSVDDPRTIQENSEAPGIQGKDDQQQGMMMENVVYQSADDQLAKPHDDINGKKQNKSRLHDGFSTFPGSIIKSTSVMKLPEDRDDNSDDDGMVMFDNVAYESFGSLSARNTSDGNSREPDSRENKTDPLVPKPKTKLRLTQNNDKQPLPLPDGNDAWTKTGEDRGDKEDDNVDMIVNDTYVSAGNLFTQGAQRDSVSLV